MKNQRSALFFDRFFSRPESFPINGQLDLTYRCNFHCVHCYSKGSHDRISEMTTRDVCRVIDILAREGCLWLDMTGGEPLLRQDFRRIYLCAWRRGFLVTLLTNGSLLTDSLVRFFKKYPPYAIEVTLNGITPKVYESVTRVPGSFKKVMGNLKKIICAKLPLRIKTNALTLNKDEVILIKKWAEENVPAPGGRGFSFSYDPAIFPRLNGDKTPCRYRLDPSQLATLRQSDPELGREYQDYLLASPCRGRRAADDLYHCDAWRAQFVVNPSGRLKFCPLTDKFSVDLKAQSFRHGFYEVFPELLKEKFQTKSRCRRCGRRSFCAYCPPKAFLETGREEGPVPYYCRMAAAVERQQKKAQHPILA